MSRDRSKSEGPAGDLRKRRRGSFITHYNFLDYEPWWNRMPHFWRWINSDKAKYYTLCNIYINNRFDGIYAIFWDRNKE